MSERKYHNEEWLKQKYVDENMSDKDISELCGVARGTIGNWREKHGIETKSLSELYDEGQPYRDEDWLREKYWKEGLTVHEIADLAGCCGQTVADYMDKFGIEKRTVRQNIGSKMVTMKMTNGDFGKIPGGYIQAQSYITNDGEYIYSICGMHQLLAIAEGADPYEIFSNGEIVVHHENGLKWDNRPDNIMVMSGSAHSSYHSNESHKRAKE